jgi:hypothetical protein
MTGNVERKSRLNSKQPAFLLLFGGRTGEEIQTNLVFGCPAYDMKNEKKLVLTVRVTPEQ